MRFQKSTQIALGSVVLGITVISVGAAFEAWALHRVKQLEADCRIQGSPKEGMAAGNPKAKAQPMSFEEWVAAGEPEASTKKHMTPEEWMAAGQPEAPLKDKPFDPDAYIAANRIKSNISKYKATSPDGKTDIVTGPEDALPPLPPGFVLDKPPHQDESELGGKARYNVTSPEGKTYIVTGPAGATDNQVLAQIKDYKPQNKSADSTTSHETLDKKSMWLDAPLVCDVAALSRLAGDAVGIQREIVDEQNQIDELKYWKIRIALAIVLTGILPWIWYFLLQRIKELREVLTGK